MCRAPGYSAQMLSIVEEVARSSARIRATLAELTDAQAQAPVALTGWTRGHVITHVARSTDAYRRLLADARGESADAPRPGAGAPADALQDGAARPAAELTADLDEGLATLAADTAAMPEGAWENTVTALAGWRHPAWFTLYRCWRELETHHVDLELGYRPADWPTAYVTWALDDTFAALTARAFPLARAQAVDLDRSWTLAAGGPAVTGPGHALLGWLSGRASDTALTHDRPLPTPPTWPLPPANGWD